MSLTRWVLKKENRQKMDEFKEKFGFGDLVSRILASRDLTCQQFEDVFGCKTIESPFALKDMDKAVERIKMAVKNNEKIAIYGDYDCDGICSTAIIYTYLREKGADVLAYIPERCEGYGISMAGINFLKEQSVDLIITVDNGIVAFDEALYAKECGIDLLITDHHNAMDKMPEAVAIVNPKRIDDGSEFKDICGAFVVFKLIAALEGDDYEKTLDFAGDLVAIATIGDVMPLIKENRLIVEKGLKILKKTKNHGLRHLVRLSSLLNNISSTSVAFGICPRINATGRLGNAKLSFKLLICEDEAEAKKLADEVFGYNIQRKETELEIMNEIQDVISKDHSEVNNPILVVSGSNWPKGLIGIVAGRLMNLYSKPAVVMSIEDKKAVGSARSFDGFSMYGALEYCSEYFSKWGGHDLAGGFTIDADKIKDFKQKINEYAINNPPALCETNIDLAIDPKKLTLDMVRELSKLGPFGQANSQPVFMIENAKLIDIVPLSEHRHLRLKFMTKSVSINTVYFNMPVSNFYYKTGNVFNLLVNVEINHYQGNDRISYKIIDMRPVEINQAKMIAAAMEFNSIIRDEKVAFALRHVTVPTQNEFLAVYKLIRKLKIFHGDTYTLYTLICKSPINYCKLSIILEVMSMEGLIKFSAKGIEYVPSSSKIDLKANPLLKKLRQEIA